MLGRRDGIPLMQRDDAETGVQQAHEPAVSYAVGKTQAFVQVLTRERRIAPAIHRAPENIEDQAHKPLVLQLTRQTKAPVETLGRLLEVALEIRVQPQAGDSEGDAVCVAEILRQ